MKNLRNLLNLRADSVANMDEYYWKNAKALLFILFCFYGAKILSPIKLNVDYL